MLYLNMFSQASFFICSIIPLYCNRILVNVSYLPYQSWPPTIHKDNSFTCDPLTYPQSPYIHYKDKAKVEGRFTGDLNHFASLIYTVCNPKRLAETLNARLESPELFKWGAVEGSLCLGLFFTYWNNGLMPQVCWTFCSIRHKWSSALTVTSSVNI